MKDLAAATTGTLRRAADAVRAHPRLTRWLLAGPGALAGSVLLMAAMPVWLPAGQAGVNHLVWPLVLAPLLWALVFLYTIVEENLVRGVAVIGGASAVNAVLIGGFMAFG
ncbi:hypothetical protein C882_3602 [Caenispirillum salinarum AK4]|uniref:Uncharacterized protein n=1 Tax=Caenispirillum salinarum AK4 TaxID=1238182 RepID=K9H0P9_9PROT|nr:hypothetical protein [Caenispirillum salinarum]EKV31850.1 hypothetical protein C882_3602 [Caenispirillum salinarum AK4]